MTLPTIEPVDGATLGAAITDIDLTRLSGQTWRIVEEAFLEYAVLVFPEQHLDADAQVAFGRRFGEIEFLREDGREAVQFSNRKLDGSLLQPDEFRFKALRGNEGWHMDSTYMPLSAKAGLLSAIEVPASGGETEFADMRAAYDALDAETRDRIAALSACHSLYASQARVGHLVDTGSGYGYHDKGAPIRPLVKTHPVTGRKALQLARHILSHPRHGGYRRPGAGRRPAATCVPAAAGVHPPVAAGRPAAVGQPLRAAPGAALRPNRAARAAGHPHSGRPRDRAGPHHARRARRRLPALYVELLPLTPTRQTYLAASSSLQRAARKNSSGQISMSHAGPCSRRGRSSRQTTMQRSTSPSSVSARSPRRCFAWILREALASMATRPSG